MTRVEAVKLIKVQMRRSHKNNDKNIYPWHYGKLELRELMDSIYGGPPTSEEEKITDG